MKESFADLISSIAAVIERVKPTGLAIVGVLAYIAVEAQVAGDPQTTLTAMAIIGTTADKVL